MPWILNHHRIRNNKTLTTMFGGLANANRTPTRSWRTAKYNIISAFCFAYNHKTIQNLSYLSQILNNSLISRLKVTGLRFADPFDLTKFNKKLFSCSCRIMVPTYSMCKLLACLPNTYELAFTEFSPQGFQTCIISREHNIAIKLPQHRLSLNC